MAELGIHLIRTPHGLQPATAWDAERLDGYAIGARVEAKITQPRSLPHHRTFFAALHQIVASGATQFTNVDEFLSALKMTCGVTELRKGLDGAPYFVPGSISFASKDQARFKEFVEHCQIAISIRYGSDLSAIMAEIAGKNTQTRAA